MIRVAASAINIIKSHHVSASVHVHFDDVSDPGLVHVIHDELVVAHVRS